MCTSWICSNWTAAGEDSGALVALYCKVIKVQLPGQWVITTVVLPIIVTSIKNLQHYFLTIELRRVLFL